MLYENLKGKKKDNLLKLYGFAKEIGYTIQIGDVDNALASCDSETKQIIISSKASNYSEFLRAILHELGHAISFHKKEISKKKLESYSSYPENFAEICNIKDAEEIRMIEARAHYYSFYLIGKLDIHIHLNNFFLDVLYGVLCVESFFLFGFLNRKERRRIFNLCKRLQKENITWLNYYSRFLSKTELSLLNCFD